MTLRPAALLLTLVGACAGPPASDAALCRDFIQRVCAPPVCEVVTEALALVADCEAEALTASGCADESFSFTRVSRERFLECRLPLLRGGRAEPVAPDCLDAADVVERCPDVMALLRSAR